MYFCYFSSPEDFLLKTKRLTNKHNSYVQVILLYFIERRKLLEKIENLPKKIINTETALVFNSIYIKENLLPYYSNIRFMIKHTAKKIY